MNFKKTAALLLASVTAVSMIAGCGSKKAEVNVDEIMSRQNVEDYKYPEQIELRIPVYDRGNAGQASVTDNYWTKYVQKEFGDKHNIKVTFVSIPRKEEITQFNQLLAGKKENQPDIIFNYDYPSIVSFADQGAFQELNEDMIKKYAPTYYEKTKKIDKYTYLNGKKMFLGATRPTAYNYVTVMRKDWLDKVGMDVPVTFDDWTNVLTAFKDQLGVYAPLSLNGNGFTDLGRAMMSGFNVDYTWQLTGDGSVAYGPSLDGWREYITQMHDWYAAGLIDPDFMSANSFMVDMTMVITGKTGAWCSMYTMPSLYESSSEDKEMNIVPVASPRKQAGDEIHIRMQTNDIGNPTAISANCKNPEIALKWLDYLYSEEGAMLANYGVEGDTYTLNDSGEPVFTDKILNNPDYSFSQAQASFLCPPSSIPNHYDWTRELGSVPEKDVASYDVWGSVKDDWIMPSLSLTSDEAVERAGIMTDIQTYAQEQTTAMITGIQDVETYWDTYVETMKSMNLDRAVEITQAAYDRYLNR